MTLAAGAGRSPLHFGRVSGAPGAVQTPNMTDVRSLKIINALPKYSHVYTKLLGRAKVRGPLGKAGPNHVRPGAYAGKTAVHSGKA